MTATEDFYLTKDRMSLNVKKRDEQHGDVKVAAYDAVLTGDFPNAVLMKLDLHLRGVFYAPDDQADIEQDYYPNLRFPLMGPISWGLEKSRMTLVVHDAEFPNEDLALTGKDIKDIKLTMKEGGTVSLKLRVVLGQLEEDALLKLLRIDNQTVPISLWQAAMEEQPDNFQQADLLGQEPHSAARAEAESLFNPAGAQSPEELVGLEPEAPPEA